MAKTHVKMRCLMPVVLDLGKSFLTRGVLARKF